MAMNTLIPTNTQAPSNTNTDAVCTMNAPTDGSRWVLSGIGYSYDGSPTGGQIVVAWGSVQETYFITTGGAGILSWLQPKRFPANTGVVITLKAAGAVHGTVYPSAVTGM